MSTPTTSTTCFAEGAYGQVEAVFHEGACSDTMEADGKYMMDNNYTLSCELFHACQDQGTRLLYASSAATYGGSDTFTESPEFERPLNVYGYSSCCSTSACGASSAPALKTPPPRSRAFATSTSTARASSYKGRMASVAFHQFNQFQAEGKVKLFGEYGGYGPGGQMRDFIFIDDVVAVNLWFFDNPGKSGIFNLGTGRAQPFNDVALAVVNTLRKGQNAAALSLEEAVRGGLIDYIAFPPALVGKYQSYTQADPRALRAAGCDHVFADVQTGVTAYMQALSAAAG